MQNPDYLSPAFQAASAGYLSTPARCLPELLNALPFPTSLRERAIVDAIRDGIRDPARWEQNRKPIKNLKHKPLPGADSITSLGYG